MRDATTRTDLPGNAYGHSMKVEEDRIILRHERWILQGFDYDSLECDNAKLGICSAMGLVEFLWASSEFMVICPNKRNS